MVSNALGRQLRVRRYTETGALDPKFGDNGSVFVSFDVTFSAGSRGNDVPNDIALLPDGRFVVAGESLGHCFISDCERALILALFRPDGTLDASFGRAGKVVMNGIVGASSVAVQSNGKILTQSNASFLQTGGYSPQLRRFNVDGTIDERFAAIIPFVGNGAFRLDQDDRPVVATTPARYPNDAGFCVARLDPDGTSDAAFGADGKAVVGAGANAILYDLFIDAAGRITIAGLATNAILFRLTREGAVDARFGVNGTINIDPVLPITAIAGDCWNRTVLAGPQAPDPYLMGRFLDDGSIDRTFADASSGFFPSMYRAHLHYSSGRTAELFQCRCMWT